MKTFEELIAEAPDEQAPAPATNVINISSGQPTMSSLQIAEITGKNHTDVLRDIRNVLEQAEISESKFAFTYPDSQNKPRPCYILPRRECDLVVSGYSVKYRLAIIDRWQELEAAQIKPSFNLPKTFSEALRLSAELAEQNESLLLENKTLAPKAAGLDRIASAEGSMTITESAKSLGLPPRKLFSWLEENKWIYKRGAEWLPFQSKINAGAMDCKVRTFEGTTNIHTVSQARLTPKGISILAASLAA